MDVDHIFDVIWFVVLGAIAFLLIIELQSLASSRKVVTSRITLKTQDVQKK